MRIDPARQQKAASGVDDVVRRNIQGDTDHGHGVVGDEDVCDVVVGRGDHPRALDQKTHSAATQVRSSLLKRLMPMGVRQHRW